MDDFEKKLLLGTIIAVALVFSMVVVTGIGQDVGESDVKSYKEISREMDKSIRAARLQNSPSGSLRSAMNQYGNLVQDESFENNSPNDQLNQEIRNNFSSLVRAGKDVGVQEIQNLNNKISKMADELGVGLPIAYSHPSLIILALSVSLAFIANVSCRGLIDWEKVSELKEKVSDWREDFRKGQKKGKRKKKLELEEGEYEKFQERIWGSSIKQAVFYLAFFVLFFAWLGYVYGGWVIAWLPFNLTSGVFQSIGVDLNYGGWFSLSYFGFAYFWRKLIIPES